jgi:hypothetical protein
MAEIKKLTKKEKFDMVLNYIQDNEMLVEFIENEIYLLNKKASSNSKTQTQIANEKVKLEIIKALSNCDRPVTITELQEQDDNMKKYSNQKISALLRQLVLDEQVIKIQDKKKTYFSVEVANI